jgi:hypothetical protein
MIATMEQGCSSFVITTSITCFEHVPITQVSDCWVQIVPRGHGIGTGIPQKHCMKPAQSYGLG